MVVASLTAAGGRYTVYVNALEEDGKTMYDRRVIYIGTHVPSEAVGEVLTHEYLHALFHDSGAQHYIEGLIGNKAIEPIMETLVRILSPHLNKDASTLEEAKVWASKDPWAPKVNP